MNDQNAAKLYTALIQKLDPLDGAVRTQALAAFRNRSDEAADTIRLFMAEFEPLINAATQQQRFVQVNTLLQAITNESGAAGLHPAYYAGLLTMWNGWFNRRQLKLTVPPILAASAIEMVIEIDNASWYLDLGFQAFCAAVPDAHIVLYNMRLAFRAVGVPLPNVYTAMHFLHQHLAPITKLTALSALDIHYLSTQAPPRTAFAGFAAWGPGNHGSSAQNSLMHFRKHVLDANPAEALPWQGECEIWWEQFNIQLTRLQAQTEMSGPMFNSVKMYFPPNPGDVLPFASVAKVIAAVRLGGGWPVNLLAWLDLNFAAVYANFAITLSQTMTHIIIHTQDGNPRVFMKGLNGKVYLGGRIDNGVLGLSTCFVPMKTATLAALHVPNQIWQVSP